MVALQGILSAVYTFVQLSPNRMTRFKEMAAVLDLEVVRFKRLYEIRWLSLGNSIIAFIRNYEPLMLLIEEDAAVGDPTAMGLHVQLAQFKFVALLHFVADVLNTTNQLSCQLQSRDVHFSTVRTAVSGHKTTYSASFSYFVAPFSTILVDDRICFVNKITMKLCITPFV